MAGPRIAQGVAAVALAFASGAAAQDRSQDNAVTQAEDAFGFSVGREALGIYNAGNARGFSPAAAGNLRIDGLYFDQMWGLSSTLLDSPASRSACLPRVIPSLRPAGSSTRPCAAPGDKAGASIVANWDSWGTLDWKSTARCRSVSSLSLGLRPQRGPTSAFPDGTDELEPHREPDREVAAGRSIEVMPFWTLHNDYDDESRHLLYPRQDAFLPKLPPRRIVTKALPGRTSGTKA